MKNHAFLESCASAMAESGARCMHSSNIGRHGPTRRCIRLRACVQAGAGVPPFKYDGLVCFMHGRVRRQAQRRPSRLNEKAFGARMQAEIVQVPEKSMKSSKCRDITPFLLLIIKRL